MSAFVDTHPRKLRLAQKIGGEYRPTIVATRHWERLANEVGLDAAMVIEDVKGLAATIPDALADAPTIPVTTRARIASSARPTKPLFPLI